jgi:hypothetical protein
MRRLEDHFKTSGRNGRKNNSWRLTASRNGRAETKNFSFAKAKERRIEMCYNCGCGMPNNDMGNPANITNRTFEEAAKAMKQSAEDAKKKTRQLLDKVINTQQQSNEKNWKP